MRAFICFWTVEKLEKRKVKGYSAGWLGLGLWSATNFGNRMVDLQCVRKASACLLASFQPTPSRHAQGRHVSPECPQVSVLTLTYRTMPTCCLAQSRVLHDWHIWHHLLWTIDSHLQQEKKKDPSGVSSTREAAPYHREKQQADVFCDILQEASQRVKTWWGEKNKTYVGMWKISP